MLDDIKKLAKELRMSVEEVVDTLLMIKDTRELIKGSKCRIQDAIKICREHTKGGAA